MLGAPRAILYDAPMGTARVVLDLPDLVREAGAGDIWRGGPGATAVDEAAGHPVADLGDDLPGTSHRTTGLAEADGRIGRIFDVDRRFGSFAATDHNFTQRGLARFIAGEWVFRNAAEIALVGSVNSTTANLDGHSDVTYYLRFRMPPFESVPGSELFWRFGVGTGASDYDVTLKLRGGPDGFKATFARWSGTSGVFPFSNPVDDGRPHELMIQIDGTAARADVVFDGALILNQGVVAAFAAPTAGTQSAHIGTNVAFDLYEFVRVIDNATITLEELRALAITARKDVLPVWLSSGTFPVIDDEGPGSHTATTSGTVVQIDRVNDLPDVGGDTIKPWGDWSKIEALRLSTSATVNWARVEPPPRRFTATFLARWEPGAVTSTGTDRMLSLGKSIAVADLTIQVDSGSLRIACLRTSFVATSLGAGFFDGALHDFRITIDDRLLVMNVWVDDVKLVENFTIGAFVTQTDFDLELFGAGLTRWTVSNVVVTRGIHVEQSALEDSAPWVEYEQIFDVRLDSDTIDQVDGAEPAPSGTTEFVTVENPGTDPDTRPGAEDETAADPLRGMPKILARDFTPTQVREVALERWDPGNPDGYLEIGSFRPAGSFRTAVGRRQTATVDFHGPTPTAVIGGGFQSSVDARFESVTITFLSMTREEAHALRRHFREYGLERPFAILMYADNVESSMPFDALWGPMTAEPRLDEHPTDTRGRFEVTIELASMMSEPQRL